VKILDMVQVGELLSRMEEDVSALQEIITFKAIRTLIDFCKIIGIGIIIFKISVSLALIVVCAFPISYWISGIFGKILRDKNLKMVKLFDQYYSFLAESISGMREVKALHVENIMQSKFYHTVREQFRLRINLDMILACSGLAGMWLHSFARFVVMGVGGYQIINGTLSMGTYVAFNNYSGLFNTALGTIVELNASLQQSMVSLERIFALLDNFAMEPEGLEGDMIPNTVVGNLTLHNVKFSYKEGQPVLKNVTFTAKHGQMTALVGPSGSGKTTISNLLLRFYHPDAGRICLDGVDLRQVELGFWRNQIAVVMQDPILFNM
jgi:ATP-binding cassette subfamily B protein